MDKKYSLGEPSKATAAVKMRKEVYETSKEVRCCTRCVMPENYPGISFNTEGVCNFCRDFETYWGHWMISAKEQAKSEAKLRGIFEAASEKSLTPYLRGISLLFNNFRKQVRSPRRLTIMGHSMIKKNVA